MLDFLKYVSLFRSIPNNWKGQQLKHENINAPCISKILNKLLNVKQTNKFIYNILKKSAGTEEKRSERKRNNIFPHEEFNWLITYSNPLLATHDVKLCNFQYTYLNKDHLYVSFLTKLKDRLNDNNIDIEVTVKTVIFGIQKRICLNIKLKNFIILIAKYFIFINKNNNSIPVWQGFRLFIRNRIRIEKEIALMKNRLFEFERLWANRIDIV